MAAIGIELQGAIRRNTWIDPMVWMLPVAGIGVILTLLRFRNAGQPVARGALLVGVWAAVAAGTLVMWHFSVAPPATLAISGEALDPAATPAVAEGFRTDQIRTALPGQVVSWRGLHAKVTQVDFSADIPAMLPAEAEPGKRYLAVDIEIWLDADAAFTPSGNNPDLPFWADTVSGALELKGPWLPAKGAPPLAVDIDGSWGAYTSGAALMPEPGQTLRYRAILLVPEGNQPFLTIHTGKLDFCSRDLFISGERECDEVLFVWTLPIADSFES
jgi:hypothetical protein